MANAWGTVNGFLDDGAKFIKNTFVHNLDDAGELTRINCNKPINDIYEFFMGEANTGIRGVTKELANNKGFGEAVKSAYTTADGALNYKAIAGTYMGGSLIGRVATGGGVYRDSTGNVNLPGVPFL